MRFGTLWVVALGFVCAAHTARGQVTERLRLRWSSVPTCPSQQEVQAEAERLLGASKQPTRAPTLDVDAQVREASGGFNLQLILGQGADARMRSLSAPTCAELGHATALVIALAIDPSLQAEGNASAADSLRSTGTASAAASEVPPPCPEPSAAEPPAPVPYVAPPRPYPQCPSLPVAPKREKATATSGYTLLAGTSLAYGALPQALPRVSLGAGYRSGSHSLEVSADAAFASSGPRSDGSGATFVLGLASPRYCEHARVDSLALGVCGALEVGAVSATGFGVKQSNTQLSYWVAAGVGLQANLPLSNDAELRFSGDVLVAVTRTRFELDHAAIFRPHALIPAARLTIATGLL